MDELESYGYDAKVLQFNIPEWVENTTPTLARTDVDPDTSYTAGTEADSDTPRLTSSPSSSRRRRP